MASTESPCGNSAKSYTIEASVPTGFESVAAEEAKEMFHTDCRAMRGKITFAAPAERVKDILKLGGIDHCRSQILHIPQFGFTEDGDDCLARLQMLVKGSDWAEGLQVWNQFCTFPHPISPQPDTIPTDQELIDICHSVHWPGDKSLASSKKKSWREKKKGRKEKAGARRETREDKKDMRSAHVEEKGEHVESVLRKEGKEDGQLGQVMSEEAVASEDSAQTMPALSKTLEEQSAGDGATCQNGSSEGVADMNAMQKEHREELSPTKKFKNHVDNGDCEQVGGPGVRGSSADQSGGLCTDHIESSTGDVRKTGTPNQLPPVSHQATEDEVQSSTDLLNSTGAEDGDTAQAREGKESLSVGSPSQKRTRAPPDPTKPVFRVTCKRTGDNHSFDSMSAAASFGSAVQTYFGWSVHMTNYNIEVMLTIDNEEVSVGLTLTPESLHRRNLVAFGVTTLRPTICHNMLRMVKIHPGHVVCDPLCGTASISIQGALNFPALQLCGDNHPVAMEKTFSNHTALNTKRQAAGKGGLMMDAVQWNACHLPLRDGIVDVFVSDLPFGKRVGRKFDNHKLYCNVLDEMARCGKKTARAALLTGDVNNMVKAIQLQKYWTRRRCYSCNIGGIAAGVFLLCRSSTPYTPRSQRPTSHRQHRHHPPSSQHNDSPPNPPSSDQTKPQPTSVPADQMESQSTVTSLEETELQSKPVSSDQNEVEPAPVSSDQGGVEPAPVSSDQGGVEPAPVSSDQGGVEPAPVSSEQTEAQQQL